jgi:hypothetical protein
MERAMKARLLVIAARVHQRLGAVGLLGVGLLCAAVVTLGMAWCLHRQDLAIAAAPEPAAPAVRPTATSARLPLPNGSDIPVLLNRIQRIAVEQGLGCPCARFTSQGKRPLSTSPAERCASRIVTAALASMRRCSSGARGMRSADGSGQST